MKSVGGQFASFFLKKGNDGRHEHAHDVTTAAILAFFLATDSSSVHPFSGPRSITFFISCSAVPQRPSTSTPPRVVAKFTATRLAPKLVGMERAARGGDAPAWCGVREREQQQQQQHQQQQQRQRVTSEGKGVVVVVAALLLLLLLLLRSRGALLA